jgi:hypothetical protein
MTEFYTVIRKNGTMSFGGKWMGLEIIMLNERTQPHEVKCGIFPAICRRQRV